MLSIRLLNCTQLNIAELIVANSECVAIIGPSGAGKTLLLRAIADLDLNQAHIELNRMSRASMTGPQWRRQVVYVAAESGWWAERVGAHFHDLDQAAALLPRLNLPTEALTWPVTRLSNGEKQRLALARALTLKPPVLLLDEPTAALDDDNKKAVEKLLLAYLEQAVSIVLVTHDKAQAARLARRVLTLQQGQLCH